MTLAASIPALQPAGAPAPVTTSALLIGDTAARLYDAEMTLHYARQSGVDPWISAAYDHLHMALEAEAEASRFAGGTEFGPRAV